jgi:ketosteroid isomerase-like protein
LTRSDTVTPEDTVRAYFAAYSEGRPDRFDELVSADYIDYGHTPPGRGPKGARDDYENAVDLAGGVIRYDIDALVARENTVAAAWTGRLESGSEFRADATSYGWRNSTGSSPIKARRTSATRPG